MVKRSQLWAWEHEPVTERILRPASDARERLAGHASTGAAGPFGNKLGAAPAFKRDPPNERDLALTDHALAWKAALPVAVRPEGLCVLYPRIANRLALCWKDASLTRQVLDDYLGDKRGGRKGFPTIVHRELAALRKETLARLEARQH